PPRSTPPFEEASPDVRETLFLGAIAEADCKDAVQVLYRNAHRSLDSVRLMYALADYFDEQDQPGQPSRGSRWSKELSDCLRAADKMAAKLDGLGADQVKRQVQTWEKDIGV